MRIAILWLRRDLRLDDNPALQALLADGYTPLPVYIHEEPDPDWPLGAAMSVVLLIVALAVIAAAGRIANPRWQRA